MAIGYEDNILSAAVLDKLILSKAPSNSNLRLDVLTPSALSSRFNAFRTLRHPLLRNHL